jgi:hypothetical protein
MENNEKDTAQGLMFPLQPPTPYQRRIKHYLAEHRELVDAADQAEAELTKADEAVQIHAIGVISFLLKHHPLSPTEQEIGLALAAAREQASDRDFNIRLFLEGFEKALEEQRGKESK